MLTYPKSLYSQSGAGLSPSLTGEKIYTRTHSVVMLSEAKHLCLFPLANRSKFHPRFFAALRMTFASKWVWRGCDAPNPLIVEGLNLAGYEGCIAHVHCGGPGIIVEYLETSPKAFARNFEGQRNAPQGPQPRIFRRAKNAFFMQGRWHLTGSPMWMWRRSLTWCWLWLDGDEFRITNPAGENADQASGSNF